MSRGLSGVPLSQKMYFCLQEWSNCIPKDKHADFLLLIFADSSYGGSCGLGILLQCPQFNERSEEGGCSGSWKYELTKGREVLPSPSFCPSASGKGWVKIFLSLYLSHSIYSIYFSLPPIPPSLLSFLHLSLSLSLLSYNSLLSTHKSKQKFPFTSCHTAWLLRQMGACSSHAHTQRGPLNIQVLTVAFIDI